MWDIPIPIFAYALFWDPKSCLLNKGAPLPGPEERRCRSPGGSPGFPFRGLGVYRVWVESVGVKFQV